MSSSGPVRPDAARAAYAAAVARARQEAARWRPVLESEIRGALHRVDGSTTEPVPVRRRFRRSRNVPGWRLHEDDGDHGRRVFHLLPDGTLRVTEPPHGGRRLDPAALTAQELRDLVGALIRLAAVPGARRRGVPVPASRRPGTGSSPGSR